MHEVADFFRELFNAEGWPARWYCGRWTAFHGWLYIISSILIALAYFSIPVIMFYLIKKTKDRLPFQKIFWLFLLFILACGFTHVFDAVMFWYPVYRVSAIVLFITAVVSWMAVFGLFKVVPAALSLKSPALLEKIIQERTLQLKQSNEHLTKLNGELAESKHATELLMKQKDDFIGIASHELKTPVTSLKAYTQILAMTELRDKDKLQSMYLKMDHQINKLTVLINDLLDTTKLEHGLLIYDLEKMNLTDLLSETVTDMQATTPGHAIVFTETNNIQVLGNKERLAQVLTNLLSNAIKYSPDHTLIIVSLIRENNMAVCSIKDFGLGIPVEQQKKIFQKFYRVTGQNRDTFPGMGLGLHIVQDILKKHTGNIWLESEENKGSTFFFSLPVVE